MGTNVYPYIVVNGVTAAYGFANNYSSAELVAVVPPGGNYYAVGFNSIWLWAELR